MAESTGRAEIHRGKDGQWYWNLRGLNGEIVAQGEGYTERQHAVDGLMRVLEIARSPLIDAGD